MARSDVRADAARLAFEQVSRRYGATVAVDGVSLQVVDRELLCLLGPSGSGKSTLLRLAAGIEPPSSGRVLLDGAEVAGATRFVEPEERRVGMVFQDFALFPHLTVHANVAFGLGRLPRHDADRRVAELLARVGLSARATSHPHMLSGGERQRVALARALAPEPRLLLMDEPFSSLDGRLRDRVRQETADLLRETGTTAVIVTHDAAEAMRLADRIALLHHGRLVQLGPPEELYARPASLAAARFLSELNELPAVCQGGRVRTPLGTFPAPRLTEDAAACVCIRPHHLRLAPDTGGVAARVVGRTFLGEVDRLSVTIGDFATPLTMHAPWRQRLVPGDTVYLEFDPADVLVVPAEGGDARHRVNGGAS